MCVCFLLSGMLVDKLKYSVAMASLLLTGLSFHCKGRPGVILDIPKKNVFSVRDLWPMTYVHRY